MNQLLCQLDNPEMTYRPWFYDPNDCDAWRGPVSSRFSFGFTGEAADFLADQLYDLWTYSKDTNNALKP